MIQVDIDQTNLYLNQILWYFMVPPPIHRVNRRLMAYLLKVLAVVFLLFQSYAYASPETISPKFTVDIQEKLLQNLDQGTKFGKFDPNSQTWPLINDKKITGYVFATSSQVNIPAYSGKPINIIIAMDLTATIRYAWVIEHHEPILLVGIPVQKLQDFVAQYEGLKANARVRIGATKNPDEIGIDAVTGATVTTLVVNETITLAAKKAAVKLHLIKSLEQDFLPISTVRKNLFTPKTWKQLLSDNSIKTLHLTRGDVDKAFINTEAENTDTATPAQKQDTFIDLYFAYLNPTSIGQNLLGQTEYLWLMKKLKPGEHAILVMANGRYSYKGNGFVRGGIFDRVTLNQKNKDINFRDLDYYRLGDIYAEGFPKFREMTIFIIRNHFDFDPGLPWTFNLLVKRRTGPIKSIFVSFAADYLTPDELIQHPTAEAIEAAKPLPLWVSIWKQKSWQLGILISSLLLLLTFIFLQNWLVTFPKFFHTMRRAYLIYTVFFIGWYGLGQLSIVNVFTFSHAFVGEFRWELFLMDPMIFILWGFTAMTILLWGRGIFCGWLCPFGALQELINEIARKLKIKQLELPFAVHERLWAVKYLILLALFGVSMGSMANAEKLAEVEPFKTSILMLFQRQWWFVLYAGILLFMSIFTRKVYCRYICPLGAALAIPTKLRLFDWLKRRPECGTPCQLCAKECEIQAIQPDGQINANECHHCLDCQVTYNSHSKCPPLILAKKRGKRKLRSHPTMDDATRIAITELAEKAQ